MLDIMLRIYENNSRYKLNFNKLTSEVQTDAYICLLGIRNVWISALKLAMKDQRIKSENVKNIKHSECS